MYHGGFSTRAHDQLVRELEKIHVTWSDAAVLLGEVANRVIGDRSLKSSLRTDKTIDFVVEQVDGEPFFVWWSFSDPHTPMRSLNCGD